MANTKIHAFPWPILEEGNKSFPNGHYEPKWERSDGECSIKIMHNLSGVPFLQNLIDKGKALFGCLVSIPKTSYRRLELADYSSNKQLVEWNEDVVGEPPMLRLLLLAMEDISHTLTSHDGVAEIWEGQSVTIPKGARLIKAPYFRRGSSSIRSMLRPQRKSELPAGCFMVKESTEEGFFFKIFSSDNLYNFLTSPITDRKLYDSICIHIVSRCFEILTNADEYGYNEDNENKNWEQYSNLNALTDLLRREEIPHWSDDEFKADKAATMLYPLPIPVIEDEED